MKIGINAQILSPVSAGVANYTKNLIKGLIELDSENEYHLFGREEYLREFASKNVKLNFTRVLCQKSPLRILWEQFVLPLRILKKDLNVFHYPDHTLSLLGKVCPTVITIHDLAFLRFPEMFNLSRRIYKSFVIKRSVELADKIITVSEFTKSEAVKLLRVPEEKIRVIYNGVENSFHGVGDEKRLEEIRNRYGLRGRLILFVGTLEPRKNIVRLIKAYNFLRGGHQGWDVTLVIAGAIGWLYDDIFNTVKSLKLEKEVIFLDYVPREDLVYLYNCSSVVVYPSLYEGFGFPPLEAMACGTPVVVSNTSSLSEVVGDAGVYVDPYDVVDIAHGIEKALTDEELRERLIQKGLERAKSFSWEEMARKTLKVYEEVLEESKLS